jgi:hypothetical protein
MRKNLIIIFLTVFVSILAGFRIYQHFQSKNPVYNTEIKTTTTKCAGEANATKTATIEHPVSEAVVHEELIGEKEAKGNKSSFQGTKSELNIKSVAMTILDQESVSAYKEAAKEEYDVFIKRHNYSPEDSENFAELVALLECITIPPETYNNPEEYFEEVKHERWSNIREFLGENRYPDFVLFYDSISERKRVNNLNKELTPDNKLDDDTTEKLILAMYEERRKLNSPGGELSSEKIKDKGIKFEDQLSILAQKYQTCAKGILSETQMKVLTKQLKASIDALSHPFIE